LNGLAAILAATATVSLTLAFSLRGPWYEPFVAALLGAVWVAVLFLRPRTPVHGLFLFLALAAAGIAAARGDALLALAACTGALFAWDAATMHRLFSTLPAQGRRRITARYAAQSLGTAAVALSLALLGLVARPAIGFPAALGVSLAVLALLAVALWQSGRIADAASTAPAAAEPGEGKEDADDA
jgi:hypothetical protein